MGGRGKKRGVGAKQVGSKGVGGKPVGAKAVKHEGSGLRETEVSQSEVSQSEIRQLNKEDAAAGAGEDGEWGRVYRGTSLIRKRTPP